MLIRPPQLHFFQEITVIPCTEKAFMGVSVDSLILYLALPQDRLSSILRGCKCLTANPVTTVQQLAYLLGRLSSSIFKLFRSEEAIEEIQWWVENLMAWNGRALA